MGGQKARASDETFPLTCGCVGQETTGAGGLAKALRTVPVVLDIAEKVRKLAGPDTWIVNFTNPVGIVTRALLQAGHKAIGLCNVAITFQRWTSGLLGVDPSTVELEHVGLKLHQVIIYRSAAVYPHFFNSNTSIGFHSL